MSLFYSQEFFFQNWFETCSLHLCGLFYTWILKPELRMAWIFMDSQTGNDKFWHFSRFEKLVSVCMKVLTTSRWPLLHAKWKGVQSLLSLTSRAMLKRAVSSMKTWTLSEWPFKHAKWKSVRPILSFLLRKKLNLAAFPTKIFTTSIQPWEQAKWKHVKPSVFEKLKNYKVFC